MIDFVLVPLIILGVLANGLRLRARVPPALPADGGEPPADGGWAWIASRAVTLDDLSQRQAAAYARAEGLDMLDLVPADLPVTPARDLLRRLDPKAYRTAVFATVCSAGAATLLDRGLLKDAPASEAADLEPADVIARARRAKRYVCGSAAVVVAPRLHSRADDLSRRQARLRMNDLIPSVHLALDVIPYTLTVAALAVSWQWGLAAAVAYCLQPYLIFGGTRLTPRGLHAAALARPVHDPCVWVLTIAGRWRPEADAQRDAARAEAAAYYQAALAGGTARFFEPRRGDCPWCGSREIAAAQRSRDLVTRKPGEFTLDRCAGCGHVFQNPRLTPDGLDFYYRDTYTGFYADVAEQVFSSSTAAYRARARMLQPFAVPRAWLDVGTGYSHFAAVAREVWPQTVFDGLDLGSQVEQGQRRGWISTGYRGLFPDLAPSLTGRYDVISMHHYLEHTTDPLRELDAAASALPPGGCLLIELPDPQWPAGRLLGRYWMPWFQPEHLNLMPMGNLVAALAERGLQPVATERGRVHINNDCQLAALLFLWNLTPHRFLPWSPRRPTTGTRLCRSAIWAAGVPALLLAALLDLTFGQALPRLLDRSNAYRVLARKQEREAADHTGHAENVQ